MANISTVETDQNKHLEAIAAKIKPMRSKGMKKGKKFADKSFMLSVLESVNDQLDAKHGEFLEREGEIIKRIAERDRMRKRKQDARKEKLAEIKKRLSSKTKNAPGGKGDHRKFDNNNDEGDDGDDDHRSKNGDRSKDRRGGNRSFGAKSSSSVKKSLDGKKKRVSFK